MLSNNNSLQLFSSSFLLVILLKVKKVLYFAVETLQDSFNYNHGRKMPANELPKYNNILSWAIPAE
jgi:hypothetical protein